MQHVTSKRAVPLVPHQGYDGLTQRPRTKSLRSGDREFYVQAAGTSIASGLRSNWRRGGRSPLADGSTYNLIGGLEWRFVPRASALVGWRYMHIDIEKGSGARTFDADIEMNGPFLGLNLYF